MKDSLLPPKVVIRPVEFATQPCDVCGVGTYKEKIEHLGIGKQWNATEGRWEPRRTVKACPPCATEIKRQVERMRVKVRMLMKVQNLLRDNAPQEEIDKVVQQHGLDAPEVMKWVGMDPNTPMFEAWLESR